MPPSGPPGRAGNSRAGASRCLWIYYTKNYTIMLHLVYNRVGYYAIILSSILYLKLYPKTRPYFAFLI